MLPSPGSAIPPFKAGDLLTRYPSNDPAQRILQIQSQILTLQQELGNLQKTPLAPDNAPHLTDEEMKKKQELEQEAEKLKGVIPHAV